MIKTRTLTKAAQKETAPQVTLTKTSRELDVLVNQLNKKFGDNAVTMGASKEKIEVGRIPTGSFSLDIALGGGIPVGRYTEISGGLVATKTTQALHIIREAQKIGLICSLVDMGATTDENYIKQLGIDCDNLIYSIPGSIEETTQMILTMQESGIVNLVVLDSLAGILPNIEISAEIRESMDECNIRTNSDLLSNFFMRFQFNNNRLIRAGEKPFTLICLNQVQKYDNPVGGIWKNFVVTVDLQLRRGDWITEGKGDNRKIVGQVVKFKVEKNKTGRRIATGEFDFYFSENNVNIMPGFNDIYKEIITCGVEWGVIERGGTWFRYEGQKWHGQEALVTALRNDLALLEKLKNELLLF